MKKFQLNRRRFVQGTMAGAGLMVAPGVFKSAIASDRPIKIGYVTPQTGPLAPFGEADTYVVDAFREILSNGVSIDGKRHSVEIYVKDSQSNPNRAAEVANDLILGEEVDIMLVASTPETTNPVADQCEINGVPCVSTVAPWQPYYFTRGGTPDEGFEYTFHFFWGLEDVIGVFTDMWNSVSTNKQVGGLFPNDGDGNAWGDPNVGFPTPLSAMGYNLTDPGRYQNLTDDFSAYISAFKNAEAEIVTGVMIPPDFTTFWTQAKQQGFTPKVASMGKAILFPVAVESLGDSGHNLSSEVWWSPSHPFRSSITGQTSGELAGAYESGTGKQWTQPIGFVHALFEVAIAAIQKAGGPGDPEAIAEALRGLQVSTIVGDLDWTKGPVPNVAKTPLVGGQWRLGAENKYSANKHAYDIVITSNERAPDVLLGGDMELIG